MYTRTGDGGQASLYNGDRLPKDGDHFQALGDVDELNSSLGVARAFCKEESRLIASQVGLGEQGEGASCCVADVVDICWEASQ